MIKINGKKMSKAWHYDACIEVWNDVAELLMKGYRGSSYIKKLSSFVSKHEPVSDCFACEIFDSCFDCPFVKKYKTPCFTAGPYIEFDCGRGMRQDAIEIAQLFIDYYPETGEELTYRDF